MLKFIPHNKINLFGKDQLIFNTIQYYFLTVFIILGYVIYQSISSFVLIFLSYSLIPLLDQIFTLDKRNPTQKQVKQLQKRDIYFRLALYSSILADWWLFSKIMITFYNTNLQKGELLELAGFVFLTWNVGAAAIAVSHQIFHKANIVDRILGTIHMSKYLYMHFTIQHLYGHHRNVATPLCHASSEKGVTIYQFIPKAIYGDFRNVYKIEKQRGKPFYLNATVLSILSSILLLIGIYRFYNFKTLCFFLVQAIGSVIFLQGINYIEHYGLRRKKLPDGTYEKVTIRHSWNAPHRFTNYLIFKIQRHSDHHQNSSKPYQSLLSIQEAPQLPHGYTVMLFMCFFPKIWFKIMDPLVQQYEKKQSGEINATTQKKSQQLTRQFIQNLTFGTAILMLVPLII